jgi:hypothetical protein
MSRILSAGVLLSCLICGGCLAIAGGDKAITVKPSTGKQLCELKEAHDKGALTDQEYASAKSKILGDCGR